MDCITNETIELLNTKDESAFEAVFKFYYPRLVYFANEYISLEDAKGVVQEAFISLFESLAIFSHDAQLRSYLYTMVKNGCLMKLRHENVKKRYAVKFKKESMQNQIYQSALEQLNTSETTFKEMETIIHHTVSSLTPRCREVFILSRREGKKNREIADDLDISIKSVEAHITNALKIFRVALKDFLPFALYFYSFPFL